VHQSSDLAVVIQGAQHTSSAIETTLPLRKGTHHWILVLLSIITLVGGQCSATLLS
ncbi:hypothetical protein KI387_021541, partial [Taxus chinensis]